MTNVEISQKKSKGTFLPIYKMGRFEKFPLFTLKMHHKKLIFYTIGA
jgi:hypothetical protein